MPDITPIQDTVLGGNTFEVINGSFDMSACSDDFEDDLIGALWSPIDAGGGLSTEISGRLRLDTGNTAAAIAGVRTVAQFNNIDVAINVGNVTDFTTLPLSRVTLVTLGLRVNATTRFLLQICRNTTTFCLRIFVDNAGTTLLDTTLQTSVLNRKLRLIRVNNIVKVFVAGSLIIEIPWTNELANVDISAENNTADFQVITDIFDYTRRPLVIFGENPSVDVAVITTSKVRGSVPARGENTPGLVDVTLQNCSATDVLVGAFEYTLPENLLIVSSSVVQKSPVSRGTLTKVDDPLQRNRVPGLPGQRLKTT